MPAQFTITYTGVPRLKQKHINDIKKEAMWDVAFSWHQDFRPLHFTTIGARRYGMGERRTKFIRLGTVRKSRTGRPLAPSGLPLTWTRRSLMYSRIANIKATRNGSRVTSPIRTFNRPTRNPKVNMRRDYTTVIPVETRKLQVVGARTARNKLRTNRARVVLRIA